MNPRDIGGFGQVVNGRVAVNAGLPRVDEVAVLYDGEVVTSSASATFAVGLPAWKKPTTTPPNFSTTRSAHSVQVPNRPTLTANALSSRTLFMSIPHRPWSEVVYQRILPQASIRVTPFPDNDVSLPHGLYDLVITEAVARTLEAQRGDHADISELGDDSLSTRLAEVLREQLARVLHDHAGDGDDGTTRQLELINELLRHVRESTNTDGDLVELLATPARVLRSIRPLGSPAHESPDTGLATPWLFTAGRGSPSLLAELRREAAACDRIDILISFITVTGVRKLIDVLRSATAADATGRGRTTIRVLTTTYTGATELAALDDLARLNGCEVRISLDGRRTRLHAKAWIFHRRTGFGSAYVGSANLSGAALMGGREWTVKFTERGQNALYSRAQAHFDTLWLDDEFTPYNPDDADIRNAVDEALRREGGRGDAIPLAFFDIQPKPYQRDMLDQLALAREHGRNRNLVVAATGTGKTVIAALDYRNMVQQLGHRPRLLFVAHRAQILRQALHTYREVLRDHSFGEVLSGGVRTEQHDNLFATIDSLTSRQLVERLGPDYWHTVVIDECHRLAGDRFRRLVTTIQPAQLLGLTATPERADGQPIASFFTPRPDGAPAVELRLWDALDMQLLTPFEYFGCDDDTDFSDVPWDRPGEATALENTLVGNTARARLVVNEWHRLTGDARRSKALAFCVSVAHAEFMTQQFNAAGIPALCVVGTTPKSEQLRAPRKLASGEVSVLVTVDLYNEGIDIPEVDTLLLLRPTQSPVLFQQQIGRGLRLLPGKESCLILDFVGQHRKEFRFDRLFSMITGLTRNELIDAVEHGFSSLPPGCHIQLQKQAREQVLRSLRTLTQQTWNRLTAELQTYSTIIGKQDIKLADFLHDQKISLDEVYRSSSPSGWTSLRRRAGLLSTPEVEAESYYSRRFGDLLHLDDPAQLAVMKRVAEPRPVYGALSDEERVRVQMLAYQVDTSGDAISPESFLDRLAAAPSCVDELGQLADVLEAKSRIRPAPVPGLEDIPLQLHGSYRIREILAAIGYHNANRRTPFRAGVLPLHDRKIELMFVTLDKSTGYHADIAYQDYAISPTRFHWQTQNSAGPDTPAGRRYLGSPANGWRFMLFVRVRREDAYRVCGPAYVADPDDIRGDRPMSIEWTLNVPLPARFFGEFSVLRGQG